MKRHFNCVTTLAQERKIIRQYLSGDSTGIIAKTYKLKSHVTVLHILKANGIPSRSRHDSMVGLQNAKKYNINQDFFKIINSEAKAYYLGLLFADGWIRQDGLVGLCSTDKELIIGFVNAIKSNHPITSKIPPKGQLLYSISFGCKKMAKDLFDHGCVPAKSHILRPPINVPDKLMRHFIRGYFDGDGCIRKTARFGFCGTKAMLEFISQWLVKNAEMPIATIHPHAKIFRIEYAGRISLLKFNLSIYKNSRIYLHRKAKMIFEEYPHYKTMIPEKFRSR